MPVLRVRDLDLHVQRLGPRGPGVPTVVFLHGLVMDNLSSWYFTAAPHLARRADVVLWDLRGHGRSSRPPAGYGPESMLDDLEALLERLGIDHPVHLVGNSYGGLLALHRAARRPEATASVALVEAHTSPAGWGRRMAATLRLQGEERDRAIALHFQDWLGRHSRRKRTRLAENARALVEGTRLVEELEGAPGLAAADLARVEAPVLALYGDRSELLPEARRLVRSLPRATLEVWQGCSHSLMWEATDRLNRRLVRWIAARAAPPPRRRLRLLFTAPPFTGHLLPLLAVAEALRLRGHEVAWAGHEAALSGLLPPGHALHPLDERLDREALEALVARGLRHRGPAALRFLWDEVLVPLSAAMRPGIEAAAERLGADAIVTDQQALAGPLAARRLGIPWITSCSTTAALTGSTQRLPGIARFVAAAQARAFAEAGLPVDAPLDRSPTLELVYSVPELMGLRPPPHMACVGPALGPRPPGPSFPFERLGPRPRLLVTLGTVNPRRGGRLLRAVAEGLAGRVRAVVVAPRHLLPDPPEGFLVRPRVPQLDLLPHVDAVLCHAGHNTVVETLLHGLPLVVAPITDDQPEVARQVVEAGVGVRVRFGRAGPEQVRAAVERVLADPAIRGAARRMGERMREAGGAERAALAVEDAL